MLVVDDALLLRVLGGVADAAVMAELERGELFTTGVWYHRLSRAAHDDRSIGSLSRELASFDEDKQHHILESLDQLPDRIGLVGWRRLVPVMSVLNVGRNLKLLAAEALAVAPCGRRRHRRHDGRPAGARGSGDARPRLPGRPRLTDRTGLG